MTTPDPKSLIAEGERLLAGATAHPNATYHVRDEAEKRLEAFMGDNAADLLALAKVGLAMRDIYEKLPEEISFSEHGVFKRGEDGVFRKESPVPWPSIRVERICHTASQLAAAKREGRDEALAEADKDAESYRAMLADGWLIEGREGDPLRVKVMASMDASKREGRAEAFEDMANHYEKNSPNLPLEVWEVRNAMRALAAKEREA